MNEEKDRFGDFNSLVERAREDVYFAQKDRKLLEKQKHRLAEAQQDQMEFRTRNCPQCGIALHKSSLMDFAVSQCSGCGGIWVERAELQRFINMKKIGQDADYSWSTHSLRYIWPDERRQVIK
jgi:Zn-finger nucleic acid-binding protein